MYGQALCMDGKRLFQAIAEAVAERFLAKPFAQQMLGVAAHSVELRLRSAANAPDCDHGAVGIAV